MPNSLITCDYILCHNFQLSLVSIYTNTKSSIPSQNLDPRSTIIYLHTAWLRTASIARNKLIERIFTIFFEFNLQKFVVWTFLFFSFEKMARSQFRLGRGVGHVSHASVSRDHSIPSPAFDGRYRFARTLVLCDYRNGRYRNISENRYRRRYYTKMENIKNFGNRPWNPEKVSVLKIIGKINSSIDHLAKLINIACL